jgi:hypothetical protein
LKKPLHHQAKNQLRKKPRRKLLLKILRLAMKLQVQLSKNLWLKKQPRQLLKRAHPARIRWWSMKVSIV